MKALLIAGGFGTRMRPLTYTRPKHLLPIANRPHIDHVFDLLQRHGVNESVLLTSYLAEAFAGTVRGAEARGMSVEVTHEDTPLGTAGALKNAQELVGDDTFLGLNGDVLTDVDLGAVLDFHRAKGAEATILLVPVDDPSAFGVVPTDEDERVLGFIEKPPPGTAPTNLINAGIYVLEPSVLDRIPAGEVASTERELFPQMVESGAALFATATDAYWMDVGTHEKYLRANLDALEGAFSTDAVEAPGTEACVFGVEVAVAPSASVVGSCVGASVSIEDEAVVERSVLLPGVRVEAGAVVRSSILGEGAVVASGAVLDGQTIGDAEVVDTGTRIDDR